MEFGSILENITESPNLIHLQEKWNFLSSALLMFMVELVVMALSDESEN